MHCGRLNIDILHNKAHLKPAPMKRIMLLTTAQSYRNTAFMQAADRLGIEVLRVVNMQEELAEHWNYPLGVDFSAPDEAAQAIATYAQDTPIDAIRAVDDSGTLVAAKACQRLGLPQNDPVAAEAARNKLQMRRLFADAGVRVPTFNEFSIADETTHIAQHIDYPCVVKPLNLSGSRGVIRANNPHEFKAAVERLSAILRADNPAASAAPYLVESYIPGEEVALEGMLDNGMLTVLALFDKPDPLVGPFFEETIYVTPSRLPPAVQAQIAQCATESAAALGLREGPVHAELRVNEQGPWILEIAGRSIGGLCSQTLQFGVDASLEELILRQACGLPLNIDPASADPASQASGVMMIPIPEAGILKEVAGIDQAKAVSRIEDVQITAKLNYSLTPLPEGDSYLGFIFARGETAEEVEEALRQAHKQLTFTIMPELSLELTV